MSGTRMTSTSKRAESLLCSSGCGEVHLDVRGSHRAFYLLGVQGVLAGNIRELRSTNVALKQTNTNVLGKYEVF